MITSARISGRQLIAILVLVRMTPQTLNCTTLNVVSIPQIGLLADAIGMALSVPLVYVIAKAGANQSSKTLVGRAKDSLGPLFGVLAGALLVPYFLVSALITLGSVGTAFSTVVMPGTPILVFIAILAFLATNASRNGLEIVGRLAETLTPVVVSALIFIALLSVNKMDTDYLRPLYLPEGYRDLLVPSGSVLSYSTQFLIVSMLIPHLDSPESGIRFSLTAVLITAVLIVIMCIVVISSFGPATDSIVLHAFTLARAASLGPFFERFEVLMMAVWTIGAGVTVAVFIWAAAEGIGELLSLRTNAPLAYPLGWLVAVFSLVGFGSVTRFIQFVSSAWIAYSVLTAILTAGLSFLVVRANRGKGPNPQ